METRVTRLLEQYEIPLKILLHSKPALTVNDAERRVVAGIVGPEELAYACDVARERDVAVHVKLDNGMGRMGITASELPGELSRFSAV